MIITFIKENFFYLHPGYTIFNTILFGIVLGLIILCIIKLFEKIDKKPLDLLYPLIPIIFFGSSSRALVDNHIYPRIYSLATPGIYILIGLMTILLVIISVYIEKYRNIKYYEVILIIGILLCVPNIFLIIYHGINCYTLFLELFLCLLISSPFILLKDKISVINKDRNLEIIIAHIFDATSTFVAMDLYNYSEQHVLPTFLINITNTSLVMYPLKIGTIMLLLYIIDTAINDNISNQMLKLSIFILGLATGLRNFTTLILAMSI